MSETELEYEATLTREKIAEYFREFASGLEGEEAIDVTIGDRSAVVRPPENPTLDVEVERESADGDEEVAVTFQVAWSE